MADLLRRGERGTPALLLSGTHGIQCPVDDPSQADVQGAIVCQDCTGFGAIKGEDFATV